MGLQGEEGAGALPVRGRCPACGAASSWTDALARCASVGWNNATRRRGKGGTPARRRQPSAAAKARAKAADPDSGLGLGSKAAAAGAPVDAAAGRRAGRPRKPAASAAAEARVSVSGAEGAAGEEAGGKGSRARTSKAPGKRGGRTKASQPVAPDRLESEHGLAAAASASPADTSLSGSAEGTGTVDITGTQGRRMRSPAGSHARSSISPPGSSVRAAAPGVPAQSSLCGAAGAVEGLEDRVGPRSPDEVVLLSSDDEAARAAAQRRTRRASNPAQCTAPDTTPRQGAALAGPALSPGSGARSRSPLAPLQLLSVRTRRACHSMAEAPGQSMGADASGPGWGLAERAAEGSGGGARSACAAGAAPKRTR